VPQRKHCRSTFNSRPTYGWTAPPVSATLRPRGHAAQGCCAGLLCPWRRTRGPGACHSRQSLSSGRLHLLSLVRRTRALQDCSDRVFAEPDMSAARLGTHRADRRLRLEHCRSTAGRYLRPLRHRQSLLAPEFVQCSRCRTLRSLSRSDFWYSRITLSAAKSNNMPWAAAAPAMIMAETNVAPAASRAGGGRSKSTRRAP
jgi:hypothetical protein